MSGLRHFVTPHIKYFIFPLFGSFYDPHLCSPFIKAYRQLVGRLKITYCFLLVKKLFRPGLAKDLVWQFQLLLCGEVLVELFYISIIHIICLRGLIHSYDFIQISRYQFFAQEE